MDFNDTERAILAMVQGDLPDSLEPYAEIARRAGADENFVLDFLRRLKAAGVIRRFGASIRHQRTGWDYNAMVAWRADEGQAESCGPIAARHPNVSHVYYRPSPALDWPYTFYTMVHGRDNGECLRVVAELRSSWPLEDYAVLKSVRELKKISMRYFA